MLYLIRNERFCHSIDEKIFSAIVKYNVDKAPSIIMSAPKFKGRN